MLLFRTTDDFNSYSVVLGGVNEHRYADIEITSTGKIYGVVSTGFSISQKLDTRSLCFYR